MRFLCFHRAPLKGEPMARLYAIALRGKSILIGAPENDKH